MVSGASVAFLEPSWLPFGSHFGLIAPMLAPLAPQVAPRDAPREPFGLILGAVGVIFGVLAPFWHHYLMIFQCFSPLVFDNCFLMVFGTKRDAEIEPTCTPNRPKKVRARNPAFGGTERAGFRFHAVKHTTFPRFARFGAAVRLHFLVNFA